MNIAAVIKAADWILSTETSEGAPEDIFFAECLTCARRSVVADNNQETVEIWALQHTFLNPTHRRFRLTTESVWRVDPTPGNPHHIRRWGSDDNAS